MTQADREFGRSIADVIAKLRGELNDPLGWVAGRRRGGEQAGGVRLSGPPQFSTKISTLSRTVTVVTVAHGATVYMNACTDSRSCRAVPDSTWTL